MWGFQKSLNKDFKRASSQIWDRRCGELKGDKLVRSAIQAKIRQDVPCLNFWKIEL
jgi:hypothetical protein